MTLPPESSAIAPMRGSASNPTRSFTDRYGVALAFADDKHRGHVRKDTDIPYVSHLISVSALVMEHGGDEDEAIAGLLHDVIEDRGGSDPTLLEEAIETRFGARVLGIVLGCSDSTNSVDKPDWETRKRDYIAHLATAPTEVLRVSCADKLHNARAILHDYRVLGEALWTRFSVSRGDAGTGRAKTLWYYRELLRAFRARGVAVPAGLVDELHRVVDSLHELARERGAEFADGELES